MSVLRTTDGRWTAETIRTRAGEWLPVRRPFDVPGPSTWNPSGQICVTSDEVRELLATRRS